MSTDQPTKTSLFLATFLQRPLPFQKEPFPFRASPWFSIDYYWAWAFGISGLLISFREELLSSALLSPKDDASAVKELIVSCAQLFVLNADHLGRGL